MNVGVITFTCQPVMIVKSMGAYDDAERLHSARLDSSLWARKLIPDVNLWQHLIISVPQFPLKLFDALITTFCDLMDGHQAHWRPVFEVE